MQLPGGGVSVKRSRHFVLLQNPLRFNEKALQRLGRDRDVIDER